tara:strand:+ start:1536 stop:1913 length:378 start_codon:yes stop_codon:yes gene_type:complete
MVLDFVNRESVKAQNARIKVVLKWNEYLEMAENHSERRDFYSEPLAGADGGSGKMNHSRARRITRILFRDLAGASEKIIPFFMSKNRIPTPRACQDEFYLLNRYMICCSRVSVCLTGSNRICIGR